jgi:hypothetical protein
MTEPRPRLTNTIGSVQQTSVVSDDARPTAVRKRGRIPSSLAFVNRHHDGEEGGLNQQRYGMEMGWIVRSLEGRVRQESYGPGCG